MNKLLEFVLHNTSHTHCFIAALVFMSSTLSSCFSYQEIDLSEVKSIEVQKLSKEGAQVAVGVKVKNPNKYKIKIKKIEADVYLNSDKVGHLSLDKKVILPKQSDTVQTFAVDAKVSNLMAAAPTLMFGGSVKLKINGYAKGKVFFIAKKYPLEIEKNLTAKDFNLF